MDAMTDLIHVTGKVVMIQPAPAPNRSGKIKLNTGKVVSAFAEKLALVREGEIYDFGCLTNEKDNVLYYNVKTVRNAAPAAERQNVAPAPQRQAQAATAPRQPIRQSAPIEQPRRNGSVSDLAPQPDQPRPQVREQQWPGPGGSSYYRPTHPRDAKRMFITATLGHFIETGRVECNAQSIANAIAEISGGYDAAIEAMEPPQAE
jgi:hypothetical protein